MATSAEELLVRIEATTESLRRELKRGEDSVGTFKANVDRHLGTVHGAFGKLGTALGSINGLLGTLGVGVSVAGLTALGRSALDLADDIGDTAGQLGIGTEALQAYRFAAHELGVEQAQLEGGIKKLQTAIGDAASGAETDVKKFKALGLAFVDSFGQARTAEDVLLDLADLVKSLPTPAEKASAAALLMGERMGPGLVPLLNQGSQGLRDFFKAADEAGQIMSDETVERLGKAKDEIENFKNRVIIATGEMIAAVRKFPQAARESDIFQGLLKDELAAVTEELTAQQERLKELGAEAMVRSTVEARINYLLGRRAELLAALKEPRTKDDAYTPPPATDDGGGGGIDLGTGGETEAEKAAKKYQQALIDLAAEIDSFTQSGREKALAEWFKKAGNPTDPEQVTQLTTMVDQAFRGQIALEGLAASRQADEEAGRAWTKVQEEGRAVMESVRTPLEAYNAEIDRANYLLSQGAISQETFNRVVERAKDGFIAADEDAQRLISTASRVGEGFVNSFSRIATAGDTAREALSSFLQVLAQIAAEAAGGGIGGLIADILKAGLSTAGGVDGEIDAMIAANPEIFRDGGIMTGRGRVPLRRYSAGGVARTPQLAMFAEGGVPEAYVPVPSGRIPVELRGAGRGGDVVTVNVGPFNITGGSREQNRDAAGQTARAIERQMNDFWDRRALEQQREGGLFWSNTVS
jgi:hypothetical protein